MVTSDFEGGNAKIINISDDKVILEVELRDTIEDWFFWCFKVCGAQGKTITFEFESNHRVGYFGAAISRDMENWKWQYDTPNHNGNSFTYTFAQDEDEVYFAHDMIYRPKKFFDFAKMKQIPVKDFCKSEKGRRVPFVDTKTGDECILLTARHHACESTGNYVLEGVLESLIENYSDKFRIICVPFVDYDGVVDGDQGKNRNGHDHNRDYTENEKSIYNSVDKIRELAEKLNIRFAFDFHSPWHCGGENDTVSIPIAHTNLIDKTEKFSHFFEMENAENSLPYSAQDNIMPNEKWNIEGRPDFASYFMNKGAELSFTLETPYFIAKNTMFNPEKARETGKCFVKAFSKYFMEEN